MANDNVKRKPWDNQSALAVVLVMGLVAILWRVLANTEFPPFNKDYMPLLQGWPQGLATLVVGWVLWRFQVRSQTNALVLEHYKQQCAVITEMYQVACDTHEAFKREEGTMVSGDDYSKMWNQVNKLLNCSGKCSLYCNIEVFEAFSNYLAAANDSRHDYYEAYNCDMEYYDTTCAARDATLNVLLAECVTAVGSDILSHARRKLQELVSVADIRRNIEAEKDTKGQDKSK